MKVTLDGIKAKIKGETYLVLPDGRTTLCILDLENGYTIKGLSACVDPAEFDLNLGRKYAFEDAFKQIWALEGYLLAERLHEEKKKGEDVKSWSEENIPKTSAIPQKPVRKGARK
jgi:hypothetical protein